jgi:PKD repeat protein
MNKITKLFLTALFCFILLNLSTQAQELKHCGSTEMQQKFWDANPEIYQDYLKENARLEAIDKAAFANGYKDNNAARTSAPTYIIPVVFHVIHEYGTENISDAQIIDAIRVMNNDWRKLNADTSSTVASFKSIAADIGVEFRLAHKAPDGSCTNGIERIYSSLTNTADDNSKLTYWNGSALVGTAVKNAWPPSKYLNIWTVKTLGSAGAAAYAYYPSGTGTSIKDGIICLSNYVGSIGSSSPYTSRTLTHEAGHYLNLIHVWGSTNTPGVDCSSSDNVSDTPTTKGHTTCPLSDAACNASVVENVQNYMDYSYCYTMFTAGQKTRMLAAITSSVGARNNLWTASNLTATGVGTPDVLCKADFDASFLANSNNTICRGTSITFTDKSWNGTATGWSWTFSGGTPGISTSASPSIQYNTPGTYDVALTVTNSSGTVSTTKTGYVIVNPSTAQYSNTFYSEGFEGGAIPNTDWQVRNQMPGGNTWTQTTAAASTGTKSVRIQNTSTYDTYVDELISPSVNMTLIAGTNPAMTFKVANAQKASTGLGSADKLQVYVSTNCGQTWTLRKTLTGAALSTAGVNATWTTPLTTEWALQTVNLSGYISQTNFYMMFRFTSNAGNNIYIDDINLSGTVGIEDEVSNTISFNIFPNPAEENTVIGFNLIEKQKVKLKLYDVLGQEVLSIFNGDLTAGEHEFSLSDKADLKTGIYFVKLAVGDQNFTKKLIVR